MPRRRAGLCRPAFVCSICPVLGWMVGNASRSYSWKPLPLAPMRTACSWSHRAAVSTGPAVVAGGQVSRMHYRPIRCMYAVRRQYRAARAKCEQKARVGATTAHRREGVGGDILLFYALQTSPGTALHTRNFFQKSQLLTIL